MPTITTTKSEPDISDRLIEARKRKFPSLDGIAKVLGIDRDTAFGWESGCTRPPEARIDGYASALGVTRAEVVAVHAAPALEDLANEIQCTRGEGRQSDAHHASTLAVVLTELLRRAANSQHADRELSEKLKVLSDAANELGDEIGAALSKWMDRTMPMESISAEILTVAVELHPAPKMVAKRGRKAGAA